MTTYRQILLASDTSVVVERARWCNNFWSKLRGFTFRRQLLPGEGLVLVERGESRVSTAIHMLFVFTDLGVVWLDSQGRVVDKVLARPWRLSYAPASPAQYVVEAAPKLLERVQPGVQLLFAEINE